MRFLHSVLVIISVLLVHQQLRAATLNVPQDYNTINSAVQAANENDIIQLKAGVIKIDQTVNVNKRIQIIGAGIDKTIIEPAKKLSVLFYSSSPFQMSDLTARNKNDYMGSFIHINRQSDGLIAFNRLKVHGVNYAIVAYSKKSLSSTVSKVTNSIFFNNITSIYGNRVEVKNSTFYNHKYSAISPGENSIIENCIFHTSGRYSVYKNKDFTVKNSIFYKGKYDYSSQIKANGWQNIIMSDPFFMNAEKHDFRLFAYSPAINHKTGEAWGGVPYQDPGLAQPQITLKRKTLLSTNISWNAVKGASGYKLAIGNKPGKYLEIKDMRTRRSHFMKGLKTDQRYYVTVIPYNRQGLEALPKKAVSFFVPIKERWVYQEFRPAALSTGSWQPVKNKKASGGAMLQSKNEGDRLSIEAFGDQVNLIVYKGRYGGKADLYINGKPKSTIDFYSTRDQYREVIPLSGLGKGAHNIELVVGKPSGTRRYVYFDAVEFEGN